jgi:hypothetical protein
MQENEEYQSQRAAPPTSQRAPKHAYAIYQARSSTHGGRGAEPEPLPWWAMGGGRIAAGGRSMMDDGLELKTKKRPDLRRHRTRSLVYLALFRF